MDRFFELCIRRPVLTLIMSAAIVLFGVSSVLQLPVRNLPQIDPVVVNVHTVYPGASAEVVDSEVTARLEESIASAPGIKQISSQDREQVSNIVIEFIPETDPDVAAQEVRDRVARVRGELPQGIEEPVISKQDAAAAAMMWIAFHSEHHSPQELTAIAETLVKDHIQMVPGVSKVNLSGAKRFALRIRLDVARMAARGVTVLDVERALRTGSVELPSGRIDSTDREFSVQAKGQLRELDQFERLVITKHDGGLVRLGDVGRAEHGVEDERAIGRYNGRPAVGLAVVRQSRANTLEVAESIRRRLAEVSAFLPEGVELSVIYDQSTSVRRSVREVVESLLLACFLVILTTLVFLRSWRATVVPALAVPISVLGTFCILQAAGCSINTFTLLALVLGIGIVVDDAIVVVENVHRHIEAGSSPMTAALVTMREIAFPIITITLALVAVFVPLAFITGMTGKLLAEFSIALVGSVVISAFVALTLSPMMSARLLRHRDVVTPGPLERWVEQRLDALTRRYTAMLWWSLHRRRLVVGLALASLGLSVYCFKQLDGDFLPREDTGEITALALVPEGSTPEYTDRMVRGMERILAETPEVTTYFSSIAMPGLDPTVAYVFVELTADERRPARDIVAAPDGLAARFDRDIEGAVTVLIMPKAVDINVRQPYELVITHPDMDALTRFGDELVERLAAEGLLSGVHSSVSLTKPELRVRIDRERANELGVELPSIARALQILLSGERITNVEREGHQHHVIVQLDREERWTASDLEQIYVPGAHGRPVQLSNVVVVEEGAGANRIERFNRQRSITIVGTPTHVSLEAAMTRTEQILEEMLPAGFGYSWKGDSVNLREGAGELYLFLLLAVLVVYMVLAVQFESFLHPFTVMLSLPLAGVGAFGLLYVLSWVNYYGERAHAWANYTPDAPAIAAVVARIVPRIEAMNMNIFSQIGLVLLVGLVTKNSILLVEFANQRRRAGADAMQAMLDAGHARLRPILMTSLATIAGILPIAIGFGLGAEARRPLGVVAVGGMISSTFLTLFVVPVAYTLLFRVRRSSDIDPAHPND